MKTLLKTGYYTAAAALLALPGMALAQNSNPFDAAKTQVGAVGQTAGVGSAATASLPDVVGRVINVVLGFIGILLLVYILYAGFLWMTAGGEDKKVEQAKTMIKNSIIGLLIIITAFAITNFVLGSLLNVAGN
jgi:heme/copper-type cytochrome/quinol oxidase subunit 2